MFAKDSLILAKNQLRLSSPLGLFISYNYIRGCDVRILKKGRLVQIKIITGCHYRSNAV
jgi:hypothetical protein